ncbi:MAG: hypothetical protein H5U08_07595 [Thermogutta sp.]|uniref:hypothetical protein n=1 Tax=Thermogutta sp. TaxID=1962930 RepID=UPI0019963911|nr:hypothetical protein [Thermogutta sp.]MBC7352207.1 hypothetical protein [Thermogutta sp.]
MLPRWRLWPFHQFPDLLLRRAGMALCTVTFTVSLLVLESGFSSAPSGIEGDFREHIRRLVAALDAPQRSVRDSAEKELESLGWRILPELSEVVPSSPEVALRLARIRERLMAQRIRQEARESRVTLTVEQVSLKEVLNAIQSQTGNSVTARGELAEERISASYQDVPFWKVIDDLAERTRAEVRLQTDRSMELVRAEVAGQFPKNRQVIDVGPVRVSVEKASSVQPRGESSVLTASRRIVLNVTLAWEPRLQPAVLWWGPVELATANERVHQVLLPSRREIPILGSRCAVETSLVVEDLGSKGIEGAIRAAFELVLPVCVQPFTFERPAGNALPVRQHVGDVTVTLNSWREKDGVVEVGLRAEYGQPQEAFASHRGWFYRWQAEIEGDGYRKPFDQLEALWLGENGVEFVYRFSGVPGRATAVRWMVPLAIVKVPAEVDIALGKLIE